MSFVSLYMIYTPANSLSNVVTLRFPLTFFLNLKNSCGVVDSFFLASFFILSLRLFLKKYTQINMNIINISITIIRTPFWESARIILFNTSGLINSWFGIIHYLFLFRFVILKCRGKIHHCISINESFPLFKHFRKFLLCK